MELLVCFKLQAGGLCVADRNYNACTQVGIKWAGQHKSSCNFEIQAVISVASEEKPIGIDPYVIYQEHFRIFQYLIVPTPFAKLRVD